MQKNTKIVSFIKNLLDKRYFFEKLQELIFIFILYTNFPEVLSVYLFKSSHKKLKLNFRNGRSLWVETKLIYWRRGGLQQISDINIRNIYFKHQITLKPGNTVLDLGSHVGSFIMMAINKVHTNGKIFAYEPAPENFKLLRQNIIDNNLQNVIIHKCAVSKKSDNVKLFINESYYEHSLRLKTTKYVYVKSTTINSIFQRYKIKTCDLLKIDIEGAEWEVFNSISKNSLQKIKQITMEYHHSLSHIKKQSIDNLIDCLKLSSFQVYVHPNKDHPDSGYLFAKRY